MIQEGIKAPDFTLNDKDGRAVSLSDFSGKKVVLYFYPKDNTPGCTRQACAFAGAYAGFVQKDVVVIGISKDSVASHQKFAEKYNLPFILLSDPDGETISAYGVWKEKSKTEDTTMMLCNRINHPSKEMHRLFADLLFDAIMKDEAKGTEDTAHTMYE